MTENALRVEAQKGFNTRNSKPFTPENYSRRDDVHRHAQAAERLRPGPAVNEMTTSALAEGGDGAIPWLLAARADKIAR
jgi:hypothetical protein